MNRAVAIESPPFPLRKVKGQCSCCRRGQRRKVVVVELRAPNNADGNWRGWVALCLPCAKAFGKASGISNA